MAETGKKCTRCGTTLSAGALQGLCARCLLGLNLAAATEVVEEGENAAPQPPPMPVPSLEEIARLFPQLEVLDYLGRGGMGAVYKARQTRLDRLVALKILLRRQADGSTDAAFAERFGREARALARLSHPDIVGVFDYGEAGGYPYLLMEYVDGVTLRQLLQGGKLSPEQALGIVPKVCEALQFAHQQGVVHRDIKPENILLDKQGRVKIADFGIAKILAPGAQDQRLTSGKDVVGTPHYMAPEQIEHPQAVDHRADIYSLGVVFYELLTGELPLGKFPPPSKRVRVDVRLDEIVLRALEKEPEQRYQNASEVKSDLETVVAGAPKAKARAASPAVRVFRPSWRLGAAVGIVLVAGLVFLLAQMGRSSRTPAIAAPAQPAAAKEESDWSITKLPEYKDVYTQAEELELQPDGAALFRLTTQALNDTGEPWTNYGFVNSDFVNVTNIVDAKGRNVAFETTREESHFRYSLALNEPVPSGGKLSLTSQGLLAGLVKPTGVPGEFEYTTRHWPNSQGHTRRVELHRLPPGAVVVHKEPSDLRERVHQGRVELFIDRLIPEGDSLEIIYRYRLEAGGGKR